MSADPTSLKESGQPILIVDAEEIVLVALRSSGLAIAGKHLSWLMASSSGGTVVSMASSPDRAWSGAGDDSYVLLPDGTGWWVGRADGLPDSKTDGVKAKVAAFDARAFPDARDLADRLGRGGCPPGGTTGH